MNEIQEIETLIHTLIEKALIQKDINGVMQLISDDIIGVGMNEQGTVSCKKDVYAILSAQKSQPDAVYSIRYSQSHIHYYPPGYANGTIIYEISCTSHGKTSKSSFLQTIAAKKEHDKWKFCLLQAVPFQLTKTGMEDYPLKFAENTLAQLKKELQIAALDLMNQSIPGGIVSCYLDKNIDTFPLYFINDSMLSYLNYTRQEFENTFQKNVWDIIHPDDYDTLKSSILHAISSDKPFQLRHRVQKKDGSTLWMIVRGQQGTDEFDNPVLIGVFVDISEMVTLQEQLQEKAEALSISEERFRIALEQTSNIIFDYDIISGNIVHASAPKKSMDFVTNIHHIKKGLILGGEIDNAYIPPLKKAFHSIQEGSAIESCEVKVHLFSGKEIWNKITLNGIRDEHGKIVRAIGMIEDITKQKEAEFAYAQEEVYRKAMMVDTMASYIINFTRNQFESCRINHPLCVEVAPETPYDPLIISITRSYFNARSRQDYLRIFSCSNVLENFAKGQTEFYLDYDILRPDTSRLWLRTTLRLVSDSLTGELKGFMYVTDIDRQKKQELELKKKSEEDSMTGVLNKGSVQQKIQEQLHTYEGIQSGVFFMLDVDHFKTVNDTFGHPFGDSVLIQVANILLENSREGDLIGRLGGDEFCVFLKGLISKRQVERTLDSIRFHIAQINTPKDDPLKLSCSMGVTTTRGEQKTFEQIYQEADLALYTAKKQGRNQYCFFHPEDK